jgi:uncharacterized membrane protein
MFVVLEVFPRLVICHLLQLVLHLLLRLAASAAAAAAVVFLFLPPPLPQTELNIISVNTLLRLHVSNRNFTDGFPLKFDFLPSCC